MPAVAFGEWATPALELELGGRTFISPPPDVERAKKILAAAVRAEINLGIMRQQPSPEVLAEMEATLASIDIGEHPGLGNDCYAAMQAAGLDQVTLDRMAYYSVFYWARGKGYADALAEILWTPRKVGAEEEPAAPKA